MNCKTKKYGNKRRTKKRKLVDDGRDHFDEYCNSALPEWDSCKELATVLIDSDDGELVANIEAYCNALCEDDLYDPFEFLSNRAFKIGRQNLVDAGKQHDDGFPTTEADVALDSSPNIVAVPAHSRPMIGCAADRK